MFSRLQRGVVVTGISLLLLSVVVPAQTLYKYRGPDGEWVFTDREPLTEDEVEVRELPGSDRGQGVSLQRQLLNGRWQLIADNSLLVPVQLMLSRVDATEKAKEWILSPQSRTVLESGEAGDAGDGRYRYVWLPGDPAAQHSPDQPYRAPFPAAVSHRVSQAYPDARTHTTADSAYAVDIAMPIGSNVHAARGGTVIDVTSNNYRSSDSLESADGAAANVVRIVHDDGTFAIYAHLNWNSIRVRPGERVTRGQYIADAGNTGFSTGPHLHFAVIRNAGLKMVSVPVEFALAGGNSVAPTAGMMLTAY
ncbi:M23 family metallopeptidase [Woeseia oceani]|uniref:M23ase beta-sheet core domain-containing protein n=1 Tax=Woeseia oceani TaxID=1548547 RepID=A0A193LHF4_9GAMM|nr:M23 family metallopeptidase [Woeseia oceani]ANO51955.1 hypothetical protein BA177_12750 [Woeseia oceani]